MITSLRRMVSNVTSNLSSCFIHVSPVPRYPTFIFFRAFLWEKNTWWLLASYKPEDFLFFRHISYTTSSPKKITGSVTQPRFMDDFCPLVSWDHLISSSSSNFSTNPPRKPKPWVCRARSVLRVQRVPDSTTWCLLSWQGFWKPWELLQRLEFNTQTIQMVEASLIPKWKNSSKSKGHI